jgi:iron(III) transport system substrate-binding protein
MGRDFLEKMSRQDLKVQNVSAAAMATMIVSGEVPLSPTGGYSTLHQAKRKGAPVEWRPIEPVVTNSGLSGIAARAPHPFGAMLFLDYLHSKEGQKSVADGELSPARNDMEVERKFKKVYVEAKYSLEEFEKKYNEWEQLMEKLFVRKK